MEPTDNRGSTQRASFIIRLWLEPREQDGPPEWRCHVRHVQSGLEAHLRSLADLATFVEEKSGVSLPRPIK